MLMHFYSRDHVSHVWVSSDIIYFIDILKLFRKQVLRSLHVSSHNLLIYLRSDVMLGL